MNATVTRAGFLTTVQDLGRSGFRQDGVAIGGALDSHALTIVNLLVGNDPHAAGIELSLGEVRIRCPNERLVAWCGGGFHVSAGGRSVSAGRVALLLADEEIVVAPESGGRAWLAISGGIDVPPALGSRATDVRNGFGGLHGRALSDGDELPLGEPSRQAMRLAAKLRVSRSTKFVAPADWAAPAMLLPRLRILRGSDWARFDGPSQAALMSSTFEVTPDADRMGVRLAGPELRRTDSTELISEAVAPGTIQVPPNGQPILLLGDCQTIGGYPKIAHVITVDLPIAAQLLPGDRVRFVEISLEEAQRLLAERERDVARFRVGLTLQTP